jgi:hypothetical protein
MIRIALLLAGLALVLPRDAVAQPKIHLSWHGCTVLEQQIEPYTQTDHVLTVSLDDIEGDFNGIDVTFAVFDHCTPGGAFIPQAWRFDPAGCRAGLLSIARPASVDGCPGLAPGLGGLSYNYVTTGFVDRYIGGPVTVHVPALLVRIQTTFATRHLSAGTRYIVAQVTIPMAGTLPTADPTGEVCGCGAAPRALMFEQGYLDGASPVALSEGFPAYWVEYVNCAIAPKVPPALAGDPDPASCLVTPAVAPSWGSLKALYR